MSTKTKRNKTERIVFTVAFVILALYAMTFIFAFSVAILNSLKSATEYGRGNTWKFPTQGLKFSNYLKVFNVLNVNDTGYFGMVWNSLWQAFFETIPPIIITTITAYAYARYNFPGRKVIYFIAIVLLTLSLPGSLPASYKLISDMGLLNSPLYFISWMGGLGTWFIVLCGFWRSVSWEYGEAAFIDGAGDFKVLLFVMIPQALPIMGIMLLLGFISAWNNANTSMLYLPQYPSISFGLYEYRAKTLNRLSDYPVYYAGLIITAIPSLILYGIFQEKIMTSMNIGGLKG